ncbi:MAG TPA: hypothetical protein VFL62_05645 [Bradyrhizobium sp.]|uniref:hypothetical protein n=1 Tax=Bradyrhizobium sp. TaxID=376 RepID=UPI002D7F6398|nr:hypothetical protein [Bradyrhizobium sp.]HET7885693.1 hypothetical protein [Bradyrhizobium sp.]
MHRAVCIVIALLFFPCQAQARHHHAVRVHHSYSHHASDHRAYAHRGWRHRAYVQRADVGRGYRLENFRQAWAMAAPGGGESIVGSRPSGCPNRFCGCEASLYKFGRIIPELNLAANWYRFPRTAPAPGMAAVRSGHVMILESQVSGNVWNVHDGNSGGHVTRDHARSIAGYTIVDPSAGSTRFAASARFM